MKDFDFGQCKLIMVGGKGGVGKTTCSAAMALHFASLGQPTLLVSSDPTPSLSDIFEMNLGHEQKPVSGVSNLYALEISSDIILQHWKERFGPEIYEVVSAFSNLDYDFVDYVGSAPGIEEEYMLNFIMELVKSGAYEKVVWDTAPAGHTLRLLHLPQLFLNHLEAAAKFYLNLYGAFEKISNTVRMKKSKRSILEIIEDWKELSQKVLGFLRGGQTSFVLVTIAEALGVRLTERVVKELDSFQIKVHHLIINNLVQEIDCAFHQERQAMQRKYVTQLQETYSLRMTFSELPQLSQEVRGVQRITQISRILFPTDDAMGTG